MTAGGGAPASRNKYVPHDATKGKVTTMTKDQRKPGESKTAPRRDFLKLAGLGALAGAAAATGGAPRTAEAATAKPATGAGYRETEHVKKAYELSRF
jgi:nitrous oxide reductase